MAVMTTTMTKSEPNEQQIVTKKHKVFDKSRPITATLDHPLILDIRFLKKLDMTTFTKKGLIALSKFCGISLINKTESKRKLNKCLKTIQHSKKQIGNENLMFSKGSNLDLNKKDYPRVKRKPPKQVAKIKPRIRFKISDDISGPEEDSSDVVCKRHEKNNKLGTDLKLTKDNTLEKKTFIDDMFKGSIGNIIPEPCKTCSRSEYPERFHSHPKVSLKIKKENEKMNLEEQFKHSLTTRDSDEDGKTSKGKKSPSAGSPQKSPKSVEDRKRNPSAGKNKIGIGSPTKSTSSSEIHMSPESSSKKLRNYKKSSVSSPPESKPIGDNKNIKKTLIKNSTNQDNKDSKLLITPVEETMKFVTGCYVCGRQMSPKQRLKHEEGCISEWRTQNNILPPEKRKPEPVRPDYRFTASGDLDPEGTFESIWANHKDSLVPCKKCGRTFFPDRIERHENCCNNLPVRVKYK